MGDNFTRFDDEDPPGLCEFGKLMVVSKDLKAKATFWSARSFVPLDELV